LVPLADEVVCDVRHDVAVVEANGAGADAGLGLEYPLTPLLQLGVVTVEIDVALKLLGTLHRAEPTIFP
jgi:hypothetical protein